MTQNAQLQKELKEKLREGIKPSDLKKKKTMPKNPDKEKELLQTIERLEAEKSQHLALIENYEKEQLSAISVFKDKEKIIIQKDDQLENRDKEISVLNEKVSQLKTRIDQIFKEKKDLRKLLKDNNIQIRELSENAEIAVQTDPLEDKEIELWEKRLENIRDFNSYREKLADKEQIIINLEEKIKKLLAEPDVNKKRAIFLGILLFINSILLILK